LIEDFCAAVVKALQQMQYAGALRYL